MPVVQPIVYDSLGEDWIPIQQASELTKRTISTWRWRALREQRDACARGRASLSRLASPVKRRGKPTWWVHRSIDARLTRTVDRGTRDDQDRTVLLERFPAHQVDLAYRKAYWLSQWDRACQRRRSGDVTQKALAEKVIAEARESESADFPISYRALQHWRRAYKKLNAEGRIDGITGLIDRRSIESSKENDNVTRGASGTRSQQAIEFYYKMYHTEQRLSVRYCHELTTHESKRQGWAWATSYGATTRWLLRYDDLSISYLLRHGSDAWCHRYMPFLDIDYTAIESGQLFQTDHHQCDFWIEHEGKQLRPWLTIVQDLRSRSICGWHLGVSPHTDAITACYLSAFRNWAIPETLRIDNGKDFASALLTGVTKATRERLRREHGANWRQVLQRDENLVDCVDPRFVGITEELGIQTIYAIPYSPWSKGVTERWFGTFEGRCGKSFATYCGNSAVSKPQCLDVIRRGYTSEQKRRLRKRHGRDWKRIAVLRFVDTSDVPTLDQARIAIGEFIDVYHNTRHSADDMAGLTPLEVWHTAAQLRRADDTALLFLMQARGVYRVGPNGVAFKVGGVRLKYGSGNPCLYKYIARDVFITIDPNHLDSCYAFTPDRDNRRFIGRLDANKRISPTATVADLREASAEVGRRRKIMHKAVRESAARTRTAVQEMAAQRRQRVAELRKTGTDDITALPSIVPVRTGFESTSKPRNTVVQSQASSEAHELSDVAHALFSGVGITEAKPDQDRPSMDLITQGYSMNKATSKDSGVESDSKDAEQPSSDVLELIAGPRYEPRKE